MVHHQFPPQNLLNEFCLLVFVASPPYSSRQPHLTNSRNKLCYKPR